jgi:hypothetical protein
MKYMYNLDREKKDNVGMVYGSCRLFRPHVPRQFTLEREVGGNKNFGYHIECLTERSGRIFGY